MADIPGFDQVGNKILIPPDKVDAVVASGGRVATAADLAESRQERAEAASQARYEALPTGRKVLGGLTSAAGLATGNPLLAGSGTDLSPTLSAYGSGVREGASGGLSDVGLHALAKATGGQAAADKFTKERDEERGASPTATGAGQLAGMGGMAALGAAGGPVGLASAGGDVVEHGVARALTGLASKGALGRAAAATAATAVRGVVEGAAFSAADQASENAIHDETLGHKVYEAAGHGALMGGALGGVFGLAGSAGKGILAKLAGTGEEQAALAAGGGAGRTAVLPTVDADAGLRLPLTEPVEPVIKFGEPGKAPTIDQEAGLRNQAEPSPGPAASPVTIPKPDTLAPGLGKGSQKAMDLAADYAWGSIGKGNGLQSASFAKQVERLGGTRAIGQTQLKYGLIDMGNDAAASPRAAAWNAAKKGRPQDMLAATDSAVESVGSKLGEMTASSGARIPVTDISDTFGRVREVPASQAFHENVVKAIDDAHVSMLNHLPIAADGTVSLQDVLKQRKALDDIVWKETKTLDPNQRVGALREVRTGLEELVTNALDNASGSVPGDLKSQYQSLKTDYGRLRLIQELTEDSAARAAKKATFGMTEMIHAAGAIAGGHFIAAPVLAIGSKLVKERGQATAAAYLYRHATLGTFDNLLNNYNAKLTKNAAGLLEPPTRPAPKAVTAGPKRTAETEAASRAAAKADYAATQKQASRIVKWVGDWASTPGKLASQLEDSASLLSNVAGPRAAEQYTASTMRAVKFIAANMATRERTDPLDPKSTPPLSQTEAQDLVQATKYALKPDTIFEDFGNGIVTPIGLRGAQALAPETFETFREMLRDNVVHHLMQDKQIAWSQRLLLDKLGIESIRPSMVAHLQADFAQTDPQQSGPQGGPAGPRNGPHKAVDMKTVHTGFDAVEARQSTPT